MASISSWFLLIFFVFILQLGHSVVSEPTQDKQALLDFLSRIPHADRVRWDSSDSACDWLGVECDPSQSFVYALRLPGVGLIGSIPENSVGRLTQLRVLSLRSNRLSGELPSDFSSLTLLRNLYLQDNELSGEFPASLVSLGRLTRLDLSFNNFSGPVPPSINNLTHLTGLFLQNNGFSGDLSGIGAGSLSTFNVSNNQLSGSIPESLRKFPASSFAGNLNLCGEPLASCNPSESPANPAGIKSKRLSTATIIGIVIASAFVAFLLLLCLLLCLRKRSRRQQENQRKPAIQTHSVAAEAETSSSKDDIMGGSIDAEKNKLVFFEGGIYSFGLEDLLRASAEVLGKGSVGISYKAVLEEGTTVVVKRLKDVVVTKKEFESTMEVLGKMNHENLVPVRAFYYSMDEKLLVLDFMASGSLSASLHGSRGSGRTPLDWSTRLKIALSTARALSYLHITGNLVHGNIKASNVLLRPNNDALLSDFGLNPFFGPTPSTPPNRVAGYRSPEVVETQKVTFKSDVYSFGVLLLELLTGKAPDQVSLGKEGIDLPRWVQSVVREEWTAEVFDADVMRYDNIEEEMVRLLQIAIMCVAIVPAKRPETGEVVGRIEEIFRSETEDGLRQSSDDPSRGSDGQSSTPELRGSPRGITP